MRPTELLAVKSIICAGSISVVIERNGFVTVI